jgi:hypothetical protein
MFFNLMSGPTIGNGSGDAKLQRVLKYRILWETSTGCHAHSCVGATPINTEKLLSFQVQAVLVVLWHCSQQYLHTIFTTSSCTCLALLCKQAMKPQDSKVVWETHLELKEGRQNCTSFRPHIYP